MIWYITPSVVSGSVMTHVRPGVDGVRRRRRHRAHTLGTELVEVADQVVDQDRDVLDARLRAVRAQPARARLGVGALDDLDLDTAALEEGGLHATVGQVDLAMEFQAQDITQECLGFGDVVDNDADVLDGAEHLSPPPRTRIARAVVAPERTWCALFCT